MTLLDQLRNAEEKLIESIPKCKIIDIDLNNNIAIHGIKLNIEHEKQSIKQKKRTLLMLPGYGFGAGAFAMCFESFAKAKRQQVMFDEIYAIDWPGTGVYRERFVPKNMINNEKNEDVTLKRLLTYAIDAIELFRKKQGMENITLLGHSLGGYLAFCYCEKYPNSSIHLILASPAGIPTYPGHRTPPITEEMWLDKKKEDLEMGKRPRTDFDKGSSNRCKLRCLFTIVSCFSPCLLIFYCIMKFFTCCSVKDKNKKEMVMMNNFSITPPITRLVSSFPCSCMRWLLIRIGGMGRYKNNGQWSNQGSKSQFAAYLHYNSTVNAYGSFSEFLYDRSMTPFSYGTFWGKESLGGNCKEIPFENGFPPKIIEKNPPYSDGRLQTFFRQKNMELEQKDFKASFMFGDADWIDCRPIMDIAREFTFVNAALNGQMILIKNSGHQVIVDAPQGFVNAVLQLCSDESKPPLNDNDVKLVV